MTVRTKNDLVASISGKIPDNNAGMISAADVRSSMVDIVDSINYIVSSGYFNTETPFINDIRLQKIGDNGGTLRVASGIEFINGGGMQYVPYTGPQGISHSTLQNLYTNGGNIVNDHPQYFLRTGSQPLLGSLGLGDNWINSSGSSDLAGSNGYRGLKFTYLNPTKEYVNVGSGTSFLFLKDNSRIDSARGVAKAWINFDASTATPVVNDSYNVSGLIKEAAGQFLVVFHSGVLKNNNYVAIGNSNASSNNNNGFFQKNTVGLSKRLTRTDGTQSITFHVMDDGGQFCDAKVNDLVIYGTEPNGSGITPAVVTVLT